MIQPPKDYAPPTEPTPPEPTYRDALWATLILALWTIASIGAGAVIYLIYRLITGA